MQIEILAIGHQVTVYQRSEAKPRIRPVDRLLWVWLSRIWSGWQQALVFVEPATVIAWQRRRFRELIRRRIAHFNATEYPAAEWTAQQIVDVFPWEEATQFSPNDEIPVEPGKGWLLTLEE